jgi:hypothetical protein
LNGTNSANIDGAVSSDVIGYFKRFYSLRPCVELGYLHDGYKSDWAARPAVGVLFKKESMVHMCSKGAMTGEMTLFRHTFLNRFIYGIRIKLLTLPN